jgi:MFS superfamily sulfate permease-like transporter
MKDDEARYLIDQFNKYASWNVSHWITLCSFLAVLLATTAVFLSITGTYQQIVSSPYPYNLIEYVIAVGFFLFMLWLLVKASVNYNHDIRSFNKRLVILEDYRFEHKLLPNKALPDCITLGLIVKSKPDELKKLLKESEPIPAAQN